MIRLTVRFQRDKLINSVVIMRNGIHGQTAVNGRHFVYQTAKFDRSFHKFSATIGIMLSQSRLYFGSDIGGYPGRP
jgi:hypothetical protein